MKIALGCDHRGAAATQALVSHLKADGHEVEVVCDLNGASSDYPDSAFAACSKVGRGEADRAILICGTGIGMCIAANKVHGIRAVTCRNDIEAEMSRRHNDANVLCMSADCLGQEQIDRMVGIWLKTEFDSGRHLRRVEKIKKYEQDHSAD